MDASAKAGAVKTAPAGRPVPAHLPLQRKCDCGGPCSDCDSKPLQRLANGSGDVSQVSTSMQQSAGRPLPAALRKQMESGFGHDFASVQVFTDPHAATAARNANARAFTSASDIVFAKDEYRPHTTDGRRVIAHELAHVVQQHGASPTSAARVSTPEDPLEGEADRAASDVLHGRPASIASHGTVSMIQRIPRDPALAQQPATTSAPMLTGIQPTIASQYPILILLLPEDDIAGLEAASEARYNRGSRKEQKAVAKAARTFVEVPLALLLTPEAQFVDADVWESFFSMIRSGVPEQLQADAARNEIMRRYFERIGVSRFDLLRIELLDPDGTVLGPSRLRFSVGIFVVPDTNGQISPANLAAAFGSIEPDIVSVSEDEQSVALGAQLLLELEEVEPIVNETWTGVFAAPSDYALNYVRRLSGRVHFDWQYVEKYLASSGPELAELKGVAERYKVLLAMMDFAVDKAKGNVSDPLWRPGFRRRRRRLRQGWFPLRARPASSPARRG